MYLVYILLEREVSRNVGTYLVTSIDNRVASGLDPVRQHIASPIRRAHSWSDGLRLLCDSARDDRTESTCRHGWPGNATRGGPTIDVRRPAQLPQERVVVEALRRIGSLHRGVLEGQRAQEAGPSFTALVGKGVHVHVAFRRGRLRGRHAGRLPWGFLRLGDELAEVGDLDSKFKSA